MELRGVCTQGSGGDERNKEENGKESGICGAFA